MRRFTKQAFSLLLAGIMLLGLLPVWEGNPALAGNLGSSATTPVSLPTTPGSKLSNGVFYTISANTTITNTAAGGHGLEVASNSTVVIRVPSGYKLTVTGGEGSAYTGGGAGIFLPNGSTLIFVGGGTVIATGGRAGNGSSGYSGTAGKFNGTSANSITTGAGGAGGRGGGGAGAGIGTGGAAGGFAGAGGSAFTDRTDPGYCSSLGNSGNPGSSGSIASASGTLYVLETVKLTANGGAVAASGGSGGGVSSTLANDIGSGYSNNYSAGNGGGGGGGAGGYAAAGIGRGGSGGAGGGGGGGGGTWYAKSAYAYKHGAYGGGGSGNPSGSSGQRLSNYIAGGGSGAIGGSAASTTTGPQTSVYKAAGATATSNGGSGTLSVTTATTHSALQYTLSFDANSAKASLGTTKSATVTYNTAVSKLPATAIPTRTGYSFTGYFTTSTGSVKIYDSSGNVVSSVTNYTDSSGRWQNISANTHRLYAQWQGNTYNVNLIAGRMLTNASAASTQASVVCGSKFTSAITVPVSATHNFMGYYSLPDGQGTQYFTESGAATNELWENPVSNPRLYALWEEKPMATSLQNGSFENPVTTNWNQMYSQGTFGLEWLTTASDGVIELANPGLDRAKAKSAYYTSYAAEGEQFAELNANKVGSLYQTVDTSSMQDQELVWNLSHKGRSGTDTLQVWIGSPDVIMQALEQYKSKTVTSGSGRKTTTKTVENSVSNVDASLLSQIQQIPTGQSTADIKTGNTGWKEYSGTYTVPNGQTQTIFAFISVANSGNNASYGNLLDNIYFGRLEDKPKPTVPVTAYPPVGGSVNILVDGVFIGSAENGETASIHAPVDSVVTFRGYPTDSEYTTIGATVTVGGDSRFQAASNEQVSAQVTLEKDKPVEASVLFARKGYVILDPNGGTYNGSKNEVRMSLSGTDGDTTNLTPDAATRTGYRFTGWKTPVSGELKTVTKVSYAASGSTAYMVAYNGSEEVCRVETAKAGLMLLAQYEIPEIPVLKVSLNLNDTGYTYEGESVSATLNSMGAPIVITLDSANTLYTLETPVMDGYVFDGWSLGGSKYSAGATIAYSVTSSFGMTASLSGHQIASAGAGDPDGIITLTANWKSGIRSLTLHLNDSEAAPATISANYTSYTPGTALTLPSPTRTGYKFKEWNTAAVGTGTTFTEIGADQTSDIELYAIWETCDHADGKSRATCTDSASCECGVVVLAESHQWGAYSASGDATCISVGTQTATCSLCNATDVKAGDAVNATAHNYTTASTDATCTTGAFDTHTCSYCGLITTESTSAALGHIEPESGDYTQVTDSTCISEGMSSASCKREGCNHMYYTPNGTTGHTLTIDVWTVDVPAKCGIDGVEYRECETTGCTFREYKAITALTHNYSTQLDSEPATCVERGYDVKQCSQPECTATEVTYTNNSGHNFSADSAWTADGGSGHEKTHTCQTEGCDFTERTDYAAHTSSNTALTADDNCSDCNYLLRAAMSGVTVSAAGEPPELTYSGATIDISGYFTVACGVQHEDCGSADCGYITDYVYTMEPDAGDGSLSGTTLTVTKAGTFKITLYTAQTATHLKGEPVTITLTVNKKKLATPNPGTVSASVFGRSDGKLTGLTAGTEYVVIKVDTTGKAESLPMKLTANSSGQITDLSAGRYEVYIPGNDLYEDSDSGFATISEPKQRFTLTFDTGKGSWNSGTSVPSYYETESTLTFPKTASRTGYTFESWYTSNGFSEATKKNGILATDKKNFTLYANWTPVDYTVSVATITNGAVTVSATTAHYEDEISVSYTPRVGFQLVSGSLKFNTTAMTPSSNAASFIMPAANTTVTAQFENTEARDAAEDALELAIGNTWTTPLNTRDEVLQWVISELNTIVAAEYSPSDAPFTIDEQNVTLTSFDPAQYGIPTKEGTFTFTLAIDDPVVGSFEYKVKAYDKDSNAKGGRILTQNIIYTGHKTVIPAPVINQPPAAKNNVVLVDVFGDYAEVTDFTWNGTMTGGTFDAETAYSASVVLTVKDKGSETALFDIAFVPEVPGAVIENRVLADDQKSVSFDVVFPKTGGRTVTTLEVVTEADTPYDMYMTGDALDLTGLVIKVTYQDGTVKLLTLDEMENESLSISNNVISDGRLLSHIDDHNKKIKITYGGASVEIGPLAVYRPPVPELTAPYNMTVSGSSATGAKADYRITVGDNDYDWSLAIAAFDTPDDKTVIKSGDDEDGNVSDATGNDEIALTTDLGSLTAGERYILTLSATDSVTGRTFTNTLVFKAPEIVDSKGRYPIGGGITDTDSGTDRIIVSLVCGSELLNTIVADMSGTDSTSFSFKFDDIAPGVYNLVADNGKWKVTHFVVLSEDGKILDVNGDEQIIQIDMRSGKTQSILDVAPNAPTVIADGLAQLFENGSIYTSPDAALVSKGGMVEIKLIVESEDSVAINEKAAIDEATPDKSFGLVMDLSIYKNSFDVGRTLQGSVKLVTLYGSTLSLVVMLPEELQNQSGIELWRFHNGAAEQLPEVFADENGNFFDADGVKHDEYFYFNDEDKTSLTIVASNFSTYAIVYTTPKNSSGAIIPDPVSNIVVDDYSGGDVKVYPGFPLPGSKVTITLTPDDDFVLDSLVIIDDNGREIEYIDNGDGTYTFIMPKGKATVMPRFMRVYDISGLLNTKDHSAYMFGYPDGFFGPDDHMTRAQMAQMFYNLLLSHDVPEKHFDDVANDVWYAPAVRALAGLGILEGYPDGLFHPDDEVTRAQFAAVVVRFAASTGSSDSARRFTDVPKSHWAYSSIGFAFELGFISGTNAEMTRFEPDRRIRRAEAAALVNRVLGRSADTEMIDSAPEVNTFPDVVREWYYYDVIEATFTHDYEKTDGSEKWK